MSDTTKPPEAPVVSTARSLIDKFAVPEETFELPLKDGVKFIVRNVRDVRVMRDIKVKAAKLARALSTTAPPEWKPWLPIDVDTAEIIFELSMLVVEPKFSNLEAAEFCVTVGPLAAYIHGQIMFRIGQNIVITEADLLEDEKNELLETGSEETTSPSAGKSSRSTPTSSPSASGDTPASS